MKTTTTSFEFPRRAFGTKINNSNLPASVPIIGIGCSSFANNFVQNENDIDKILSCQQDNAHLLIKADNEKVQGWIQTLQYAVDNGINLLDTAPWYGHGSSEVVIGLALKELFEENHLNRSDIIINTKIGRYDSDPIKQFDFSYDTTIRSVERSIIRMNCQYIDVLQLHDPEFSPSVEILLEETIPAMIECQKRGWVKALGMTGYPLETHYEILQRLDSKYNGEIVFDQTLTYGHFNLHNQNLFTMPFGKEDNNSKQQESIAEYCQSLSMGLMAAAPLSMGLLTHSPPPFWHPASEPLKQACKDASNIANDNGVDLPTIAILFALAHDCISCTLLGMGCMRDVDVALSTVKRYTEAISTDHNETSISVAGAVADHGKSLKNQIQSKLAQILTEEEQNVLTIILDEANGPFAEIWENGEYAWDGRLEATKFWSTVPGGIAEAEKRMRVRSS